MLVVLFCFVATEAQSKTDSINDSSYYDQLLDVLFPKNILDKPGRRFILILRYKPSFTSESQIVISGREDDVNVVEFTSMDENIYYKLSEILDKTDDEPDIAELAKQFRVRKRELKLPLALLNNWRQKVIKSVSQALIPKIQESVLPKADKINDIEDGTSYELWDSSLAGDLYFKPSGNEEQGRDFSGKKDFIKILEGIKREVAKQK
jgi:hypothetical protein